MSSPKLTLLRYTVGSLRTRLQDGATNVLPPRPKADRKKMEHQTLGNTASPPNLCGCPAPPNDNRKAIHNRRLGGYSFVRSFAWPVLLCCGASAFDRDICRDLGIMLAREC